MGDPSPPMDDFERHARLWRARDRSVEAARKLCENLDLDPALAEDMREAAAEDDREAYDAALAALLEAVVEARGTK
jgi:hypothetical protein